MSFPTNDKDLELIKVAIGEGLSGPLMKAFGPIMVASGLAGVAGLATYFKSKSDQKQHQEDLAKSLQATYSMDKAFGKSPENFAKLFGELSVMAPTVAKSPNLASKLISQRMKTGFGLDDVHKLSVIESSGGINRTPKSPGAAATGAAASALSTLGITFGPSALPGMIQGAHEVQKITSTRVKAVDKQKEDADKAQKFYQERGHLQASDPEVKDLAAQIREMMKKQSSDASWDLRVSEECLGKMVSDRVTLFKEATVKSRFGAGMRALTNHLAYIAPALALGGGIGLVKLVHDRMQDSSLQSEADANFARLMRSSKIAKGNPEVARESFETLKMVAPVLATRPGVLRSFIENQANTGVLPNYEQVKALAETGQAVGRATEGKGFFSGVKDVMDFAHIPVKKEKWQS